MGPRCNAWVQQGSEVVAVVDMPWTMGEAMFRLDPFGGTAHPVGLMLVRDVGGDLASEEALIRAERLGKAEV